MGLGILITGAAQPIKMREKRKRIASREKQTTNEERYLAIIRNLLKPWIHFAIYGVAIIHAHIFATLKGLAGKSPRLLL
jgi:hypothetical protein